MANLEVLALDTAVPQIRAPGAGDGYSVPRDMTMASGTTLAAQAVTSTSLGTTGNLTFSGTAQRITGDMSNATWANRLAVQTSTTNGNTNLTLLPNGTGANSQVALLNSSDTANNSYLGLVQVGTTESRIQAAIQGTGSYTPMTFYTGGSERMRLDTSGNLGIGTTSPGDLLQVNRGSGSGVTSGIALTTAAGGAGDGSYIKWTGAGTNEKIARIDGVQEGTDLGSIRFNTGNGSDDFAERLRIDSSGNVGIGGTAAAFSKLAIAGTLPTSSNLSVGLDIVGTIPSGTTSGFDGVLTRSVTAAASFTLTNLHNFRATQGTLGAGSTVTNQYGFVADSSLTGATNNYGFYSNIASGSNRWNFYAAGTAANYFAGNTGIGGTPSTLLHVIGSNGAPSATANNQFFTIEANTSVQLAFGGEAGGVNNAWIQTKQSNNSGSLFTININPLGGSVAVGKAIATNATTGFLYVPTCAGTPTGTPTTITGTAPIVVDTTNNKLYFYSGGQWRDAGP